jgi:LPS O-antigen subunit length determinant protein (WzzB/FepE family)
MKKTSKKINNEINLIDLARIFWNGKWKIVMSIAIASIFVFIIQPTQKTPEKNFTAITEIMPINSLEEYKYSAFNDYYSKLQKTPNFFTNEFVKENLQFKENFQFKEIQITGKHLFNLYGEVLLEKMVFKKALHEHKFLDIKEYSSEELYYEEIDKVASSIKINFPKSVTVETTAKEQIIYNVEFKYYDAKKSKKWKSLLTSVNELTNQAVKQNLRKKFRGLLLSEKIRKEHVLEDTAVLIKNLLEDYETKSINRISYLREQAAIAKKLGIAKNTIEVQTFGNQNALLSNVKTDSPFYLRGYEAINKEIELMLSRTNKEGFISGLLELEQKLRKLKQDKSIKRLQLLFDKTPLSKDPSLVDGKVFYAANFTSTRFDYDSITEDQQNFIPQGILIGLIIGLLYTLISNRLQSQKANRKKNN